MMIDIRPACILCGCKWVPAEGVDSRTTACATCCLDYVAETAAFNEEVQRARHDVLFAADMLERSAARQAEWSGPAQALFTAVQKWRKVL